MTTQFNATHVTTEGQFVKMINPAHGDSGPTGVYVVVALVRTRTGRTFQVPANEVHELGTDEAAEILDSLGVRSELECQVDDSHRTTLANWAVQVNEARQALQNGVESALSMAGNGGPGWGARRVLEEALANSAAQLAKFKP